MKNLFWAFICFLSTLKVVLGSIESELISITTKNSDEIIFSDVMINNQNFSNVQSSFSHQIFSENLFFNFRNKFGNRIFGEPPFQKAFELDWLLCETNSITTISTDNTMGDFNISDTTANSLNKYIFKYKTLEPVQPIFFNPPTNKIHFGKLALITIGTSASVAILHYHQSKAWWQANRTKFHFQNDWEYALWIDKLGHWWGATAIQHIFTSSLSWSNFSDQSSVILGSLLALTYQLYVETYDGYASNWGFSPGDALFDFGGAFYPLLQYYIPPLKNLNLKLSYFPSKRLLRKDPLDSLYKNKFVIDDYEGQSFYLSFKMNDILPESLEKFWPDFLCLALGYQIRNWNGYASADKNFYFALDYDFEQIPLYGKFWQFLKNTFNLFHLPAPAIKYSNKKFIFTIAY